MSFIDKALKRLPSKEEKGVMPPPKLEGGDGDNDQKGAKKSSKAKIILVVLIAIVVLVGVVGALFSDVLLDYLNPPPPPRQERPVYQEEPQESLPIISQDQNQPATETITLEIEESPAINEKAPIVEETIPAPLSKEPAPVKTEVKPVAKEPVKAAEKPAVKAPAKATDNKVTSKPAPVKPATPKQAPAKTEAKTSVATTAKPTQTVKEPVMPTIPSSKSDKQYGSYTHDASSQYLANQLVRDAEAALAKGDLTVAIGYYEQAYLYNRSPSVALNVMTLSIRNKNPEKAMAFMKHAVITEDNYRDVIMEMVDNKYYNVAEEAIRRNMFRDVTGQISYSAGYMFESRQLYDHAANEYKRAMMRSNYDPLSIYSYARMLERVGDLDNAIKYYTAVVDSNGDISLRQSAANQIKVIKDARNR